MDFSDVNNRNGYSNGTKEFWCTGKMLFGLKFIRFMEGFKNCNKRGNRKGIL